MRIFKRLDYYSGENIKLLGVAVTVGEDRWLLLLLLDHEGGVLQGRAALVQTELLLHKLLLEDLVEQGVFPSRAFPNPH